MFFLKFLSKNFFRKVSKKERSSGKKVKRKEGDCQGHARAALLASSQISHVRSTPHKLHPTCTTASLALILIEFPPWLHRRAITSFSEVLSASFDPLKTRRMRSRRGRAAMATEPRHGMLLVFHTDQGRSQHLNKGEPSKQ